MDESPIDRLPYPGCLWLGLANVVALVGTILWALWSL